jgi:uncharacterized protein Yka (UPF0111/DUF47 family)
MSKFDNLYKLTDMVNSNVNTLRTEMNQSFINVDNKIDDLTKRVITIECKEAIDARKRFGRIKVLCAAMAGFATVVASFVAGLPEKIWVWVLKN